MYWQLLHRRRIWILPILGVCFLIAGVGVLVLDSVDKLSWVVLLTLGTVILLIFIFQVPLTPNRIWKRVKKQFEVWTLDISDEGIYRHTALNETMMRWPMFSETLERGDLYLLIIGDGPGLLPIPRRAFASEADEMTFREIAERSTLAHLAPISS